MKDDDVKIVDDRPQAHEPANERPGYKSLFRRNGNQPNAEVFAFFPKEGGDWDGAFRRLAAMALQGEVWESHRPGSAPGNVDILKNYLNYTFLRLQDEDKILFSKDGKWACFNSGLSTADGDADIIAFFVKTEDAEAASGDFCVWRFTNFGRIDGFDFLRYYGAVPPVAQYERPLSEWCFDFHDSWTWNVAHIVKDNSERLPDVLKENPYLASIAIEGALLKLKERIKRNPRLAVPCWNPDRHCPQQLMPLYLLNATRPDCALLVDKDEENEVYCFRTVLTLEMAYTNARLISRPDSEWLRLPSGGVCDDATEKDASADADANV